MLSGTPQVPGFFLLFPDCMLVLCFVFERVISLVIPGAAAVPGAERHFWSGPFHVIFCDEGPRAGDYYAGVFCLPSVGSPAFTSFRS
ncbi:hypothetical protein Mboo_0754 [Methanoregula boonei 6A8]|uniref:Uncharacterized protein n=1 Tax=Methanoregula boonei (strain DSM 21154 / JCM 14090 / 6A8) TaxID=456442 RepID=A7I6B1_METB6|nr:hypothetical protein Mboo_0754 [Methanoregula boonei 6A8]